MRRHPHPHQPMQDPGGLLLKRHKHYAQNTSGGGGFVGFLWNLGLIALVIFALSDILN